MTAFRSSVSPGRANRERQESHPPEPFGRSMAGVGQNRKPPTSDVSFCSAPLAAVAKRHPGHGRDAGTLQGAETSIAAHDQGSYRPAYRITKVRNRTPPSHICAYRGFWNEWKWGWAERGLTASASRPRNVLKWTGFRSAVRKRGLPTCQIVCRFRS